MSKAILSVDVANAAQGLPVRSTLAQDSVMTTEKALAFIAARKAEYEEEGVYQKEFKAQGRVFNGEVSYFGGKSTIKIPGIIDVTADRITAADYDEQLKQVQKYLDNLDLEAFDAGQLALKEVEPDTKAEADRIAKEKADADQAEADRIAKEKADADQAEADRIAKEKADSSASGKGK